jgi:hypothetical protein
VQIQDSFLHIILFRGVLLIFAGFGNTYSFPCSPLTQKVVSVCPSITYGGYVFCARPRATGFTYWLIWGNEVTVVESDVTVVLLLHKLSILLELSIHGIQSSIQWYSRQQSPIVGQSNCIVQLLCTFLKFSVITIHT